LIFAGPDGPGPKRKRLLASIRGSVLSVVVSWRRGDDESALRAAMIGFL
jgi:hypothetical protein